MILTNTFYDDSWTAQTVAGWYRILGIFVQIFNGEPVKWDGSSDELFEYYIETLDG